MVYVLNVQPEWGFEPKRNWDGEDGTAPPIPVLHLVDDGGVSSDSYHAGLPVDGGNFPKWVRWSDPGGNSVPDFDNTPFLSVSEKAKATIEQLEPGVHQFFPVEYRDKDGRPSSIRYWFVPCNRIDSVDRSRSNMVLRHGRQWMSPKNASRLGEILPGNVDVGKPAAYVFNLKAIAGRHIWRDKHIGGATCFISDAMGDAFKLANLTGLKLDDAKAEAV